MCALKAGKNTKCISDETITKVTKQNSSLTTLTLKGKKK
jgi:hypothetical protein